MNAPATISPQRRVRYKTSGQGHRPIIRLMSPGDLGQVLKPFVFLDLFSPDAASIGDMPIHPHSGIATVTVLTEGDLHFDDPISGSGSIGYGGVEWMRAGGGVWHGKEMSKGSSPRIKGFQLWLALPPELENAAVDSQYIEAKDMPVVGPATVILGALDGAVSPVRAPNGINYLLVTLAPGERWTYTPPADHDVAWLAISHGALVGDVAVHTGELALLEGGGAIPLQASAEGARFVVASAVGHPHDLVTGYYSVHTNKAALIQGEARIAALRERLPTQRSSGPTPVFRG
ncbi:redox-sensitive bicupin YhaK (pirin superfamily) [Novosphingobium sp. SG751A]|uniref:pirin family protein n=1 Tax=Novosphingobium sp. SG751A TaxID=2587000 RepID=UPI001C12BF47|nr:pirin family protein [Novosphingobium sp. SG751A]NOW48912.1 redox-sensitive bicupin YhaK (pirin superfamily) [Novosphingobium sp. SG751A]